MFVQFTMLMLLHYKKGNTKWLGCLSMQFKGPYGGVAVMACSMACVGKNIANGGKTPIYPCHMRTVHALCARCARTAPRASPICQGEKHKRVPFSNLAQGKQKVLLWGGSCGGGGGSTRHRSRTHGCRLFRAPLGPTPQMSTRNAAQTVLRAPQARHGTHAGRRHRLPGCVLAG